MTNLDKKINERTSNLSTKKEDPKNPKSKWNNEDLKANLRYRLTGDNQKHLEWILSR